MASNGIPNASTVVIAAHNIFTKFDRAKMGVELT
jgi:hypothetical protein